MAGRETKPKKQEPAAAKRGRNAVSGLLVGTIDETDARRFQRAITAFKKAATSSKADAIQALQASGYLDSTGKLSKRYR